MVFFNAWKKVNNLMDKRKEPLDKNWESSTIKYDTQVFAENQIEFMKRQPKQTQMWIES